MVYVLIDASHEGYDFVGLFSSKDAAAEHCTKRFMSRGHYVLECCILEEDKWFIDEWLQWNYTKRMWE